MTGSLIVKLMPVPLAAVWSALAAHALGIAAVIPVMAVVMLAATAYFVPLRSAEKARS